MGLTPVLTPVSPWRQPPDARGSRPSWTPRASGSQGSGACTRPRLSRSWSDRATGRPRRGPRPLRSSASRRRAVDRGTAGAADRGPGPRRANASILRSGGPGGDHLEAVAWARRGPRRSGPLTGMGIGVADTVHAIADLERPDLFARSGPHRVPGLAGQDSRAFGTRTISGSVKTSYSSRLCVENSETMAPSGEWNQCFVIGGIVCCSPACRTTSCQAV